MRNITCFFQGEKLFHKLLVLEMRAFNGGPGVVLESSQPHIVVGIGGHGEAEGGPGVVVRSPRPSSPDLDPDELDEDPTLLPASQLPVQSEEIIEQSEVIEIDSLSPTHQIGSGDYQEDVQVC